MLSSPNRPLSEQKSERWPNMLRWRVNMTSPGGGDSSDGSGRAVAGQPECGCEKGCRDDRRHMADGGRRSLMAEEAKSFCSYCLARKRSEKAKGRAGASPRAPAAPSRPSAPLRLPRAGSSTTRLHLSRREEGLLPEDQGRRAGRSSGGVSTFSPTFALSIVSTLARFFCELHAPRYGRASGELNLTHSSRRTR